MEYWIDFNSLQINEAKEMREVKKMDTVYLIGMVLSGLFFGWTIGSHYTGAVMGTAFGYPTSMNQAMIGGIAGAGLSRGINAINMKTIKEIVISWFLTPLIGAVVAFVLYSVLSPLLGIK